MTYSAAVDLKSLAGAHRQLEIVMLRMWDNMRSERSRASGRL